ncbi:MAG: hypothetical protein AAGJ46_13355 [Planctomycetota bacterium]
MTLRGNFFSLIAALGCAPLAFGGVVFQADFENSTPVDGAVTANADVANLAAGTQVGSWALSGAGGNPPGAIIDNAAGDNNAFVVDQGISGGGNNRITGLFTERVDLALGNELTFEFDLYASRQGGGREVRLALTDSGGTVAGDRAYVLIFGLDNTKNFNGLNTSNAQPVLASTTGPNTGFTNASDGSYLSWNSGTTIGVKIDVSGITTLSDDGNGPPAIGAKLSVDWAGDGSFTEVANGDVELLDFGPRDGGVTGIDRFEIFYSGGTPRGAYVDNIVATLNPIPEPASAAFLTLAAPLAWRRRR